MAQQTKQDPKITFPPNVRSKSIEKNKLVLTELKEVKLNVVGTSEGGVVLENETGEKLILGADNSVTPLESNKRWTPIKTRPKDQLKLIGTTTTGIAVWAGPDGKGCTIDLKTGKTHNYIGHVTLLR